MRNAIDDSVFSGQVIGKAQALFLTKKARERARGATSRGRRRRPKREKETKKEKKKEKEQEVRGNRVKLII